MTATHERTGPPPNRPARRAPGGSRSLGARLLGARSLSARLLGARSLGARSLGARRRGPSLRRNGLRLLLLAGIGSVTLAVPVADADAADLDFPFRTDFTTAAGGTLSGDAAIDDGWLRLTPNLHSQAGGWSTNDVFPSSLGLQIEFRYAMHGGDGADGLLMYLADGASPAGVGQPGGSLGYACADAADAEEPCDLPGVPGGWVGLGFDEYGNFSRPINGSGPGFAPETIALRGSSDDLNGYRYLRGAPAPGGQVETSSRLDARTVRVTIQPDAAGTLAITLRSDAGPGTPFRTLLDQVPLTGPEQVALPPTLRLGFAASTGRHANTHEIDHLRVAAPTDLRIEHAMPASGVAGERFRYTVTASDVGQNDAAPSDVHVDVPAALRDVSWTCAATTGSACGAGSGTGNTIETTADLVRGGMATYTIEGTLPPDSDGSLVSAATVVPPASRGDIDETDNASRAVAPIAAQAALSTAKRAELLDGADALAPGDEFEYVVTATNHGPSDAASVGMHDDLPEQVTFVSSDDDCSADGQRVTCRSEGALAPNEDHEFRFRTALAADYRGDGSDVVNIATATSPTDPDEGEPSDPVTLPPVDLGGGDAGGGGDPGDGSGDSGDGGGDPGDGGGDPGDGGGDPGDGGGDQGDNGDGPGGGDDADDAEGPSAHDAADAADGTAASRPTSTRAGGLLAYTGADGLAATGGAAALLTAAGIIAAMVRRRPRAVVGERAMLLDDQRSGDDG